MLEFVDPMLNQVFQLDLSKKNKNSYIFSREKKGTSKLLFLKFLKNLLPVAHITIDHF
jgi:hypothetical protein